MTAKSKNPPDNEGNARDVGSIPESGGSPGEEKGYLLQYSCLENPTDRGAWQATVRGVAQREGKYKLSPASTQKKVEGYGI